MKTPKDAAIMLGALSFIRVDGLTLLGHVQGGRVCRIVNQALFNGSWCVYKEFILVITKDCEIWIGWNQGLPDIIIEGKISMCAQICQSLGCWRKEIIPSLFFCLNDEQFDTRQLLSRMNNPEWEPGD
jgi:hypothetical protein